MINYINNYYFNFLKKHSLYLFRILIINITTFTSTIINVSTYFLASAQAEKVSYQLKQQQK